MRAIDDSVEPLRGKAEELAQAHLKKKGLVKGAKAPEGSKDEPTLESKTPEEGDSASEAVVRLECPKCSTSNEADAAFCKKCGHAFASEETKHAKLELSRSR